MIILQASKRLHRSHSNGKHQTQRFSDFVEQRRSMQYKRTSRAERKTAEKVETGDRKAKLTVEKMKGGRVIGKD